MLNFVHSLAALCFFFFHFTSEIFRLFLVFQHQGSLSFLSVPILSLDRFLQVSNLLLQLVSLLLFDEDLMGRVWQFAFVACLATHDLEDCQGTIGSRSVEILVLIVDTNASDVLGMRLDFELLVGGEGVHDHLDRARFVRVVHARKEGPAVEEHLDLVEDDTLEEGANDCALSDLTDGLVLAGREDRDLTLLAFGLVDAKAREVNIRLSEGPDGVCLAQSPHMNRRIERR